MDDLIYVYDTISQISTNVYIDNLHYHLLKCCRLKPSKSLEWVFLKTQIRMFCESECNQCIPCPWGGPVWDTKGQVLWIRGEREAHSDCSSFLQYDGQHPPAHQLLHCTSTNGGRDMTEPYTGGMTSSTIGILLYVLNSDSLNITVQSYEEKQTKSASMHLMSLSRKMLNHF